MTDNTIRLSGIDGDRHHYHFCPSCYYLIFGEDVGQIIVLIVAYSCFGNQKKQMITIK